MGIVSRYLTLTWLRLLLLCQGSFLAVYLVLDMMERIPGFLRYGGEVGDMLRFFLWKLPEMVGQTAAFSVLMATLLTLGLLSRNSEIVAMRASGISLPRISLPLLLLGAVVGLGLLVNAELVVPFSFVRMARIERVDIKKQGSQAVFKRNNIWFRSDNRIVQANLFVPQAGQLKGVIVWTLDGAMNPVSRMDADSAEYRGEYWLLRSVELREFQKGGGVNLTRRATLTVPLNLKIDDLRVLDKDAEHLNFFRLKEYADNLVRGGYQAYRYQTLMHTRLAAPFSAVVMVILGIPFALRTSRTGGMALGIGASVAIGFAYFVVNAILLSYGSNGVLPPLVAAWGANFLFVLGGVWLALTIRN